MITPPLMRRGDVDNDPYEDRLRDLQARVQGLIEKTEKLLERSRLRLARSHQLIRRSTRNAGQGRGDR
jgi:hypothetical protein